MALCGLWSPNLCFFTLGYLWAPSVVQKFYRLTQSVRHMMKRSGLKTIIVYLDDFLVIGETKEECQKAFSTLLQLLQYLGFQISWHKDIGPTQKLVFLAWSWIPPTVKWLSLLTNWQICIQWSPGFFSGTEQARSSSSNSQASLTGHVG